MKYFDIHTHTVSSNQNNKAILNILAADPVPEDKPFSIGLHPWFIEEKSIDKILCLIKEISIKHNCAAIGECGLDRIYFRETDEIGNYKEKSVKKRLELQMLVFKGQVEIANSADKPVIIHCVRAFSELLGIRKSIECTTPWIIHGFRGSKEVAESLIKEGIYLSFGKSLLNRHPAGSKIRAIFKELPENRIFLETDNVEEPLREISDIYTAAADIRNESIEAIKDFIKKNAWDIFQIGLK